MLNYLLGYIQQIIKKVKGILLARPRVVKYGQGEVILKNLTKEEADLVVSLLTNKVNTPFVQEQVALIKEEIKTYSLDTKSFAFCLSTPVSEMIETALGLYKDLTGSYSIVEVGYNHTTKDAKVNSTKGCGKVRAIAESEFKVAVVKKFL